MNYNDVQSVKEIYWKQIADRRKELLVEIRQLLDAIYAEDIVSSGDLGKVYEKIERELADE